VCASQGIGNRNPVFISDNLIVRQVQVWEGSTKLFEEMLEALWPSTLPRSRVMVNSIWCDDLIESMIILPAASAKRFWAAKFCSFDMSSSWTLRPSWYRFTLFSPLFSIGISAQRRAQHRQ
jgi:hypothetical protein